MVCFQEQLKGLRDIPDKLFAPCTYKRVACSSSIHENNRRKEIIYDKKQYQKICQNQPQSHA